MAKIVNWTAGMSQEERDAFNELWVNSDRFREAFASLAKKQRESIRTERLALDNLLDPQLQTYYNITERHLNQLINWLEE